MYYTIEGHIRPSLRCLKYPKMAIDIPSSSNSDPGQVSQPRKPLVPSGDQVLTSSPAVDVFSCHWFQGFYYHPFGNFGFFFGMDYGGYHPFYGNIYGK